MACMRVSSLSLSVGGEGPKKPKNKETNPVLPPPVTFPDKSDAWVCGW